MREILPNGSRVVTLRDMSIGVIFGEGERDHVKWGRSGSLVGMVRTDDGENGGEPVYIVEHDFDGTTASYLAREIMSSDPRVSARLIFDRAKQIWEITNHFPQTTEIRTIRRHLEDIGAEVDWVLNENFPVPSEIDDKRELAICPVCDGKGEVNTTTGLVQYQCPSCKGTGVASCPPAAP